MKPGTQTATFFLYYLGVYGKAVKVSDGVSEFFLPLSQTTFVRPNTEKSLEPIKFTIPEWLAAEKGLYDSVPGSLKAMVTIFVKVIYRGDKSWNVTDGISDPVWIDKRMIKLRHINTSDEAEIEIPEWYAKKKGLVD